MHHFPLAVAEGPVVAVEPAALPATPTAFNLSGCAPLQLIKVNTRSSVYELIVLNARRGRVLLRGGRLLPRFRRVTFAGSTAGGSALKQNTIDVGLRMEFHIGRDIVLTSAVRSFARESFVRAIMKRWARRASEALI